MAPLTSMAIIAGRRIEGTAGAASKKKRPNCGFSISRTKPAVIAPLRACAWPNARSAKPSIISADVWPSSMASLAGSELKTSARVTPASQNGRPLVLSFAARQRSIVPAASATALRASQSASAA